MEKKLVIRTITLARLMTLPTLMVITGLSFATQVLPSALLTEGTVLVGDRCKKGCGTPLG